MLSNRNIFIRKRGWISLLTLALIVLFTSCSDGGKNKPDVSGISIDVKVHRFDQDFFSLDTTRVVEGLEALQKKHPGFLPIYFEYLSPINFIMYREGKPYNVAVMEYFRNIKPLYDSVNKKYPSFDKFEKDLEHQLRYVKHYFPDFKTPAVYTTVESLNPENKEEIYGALYFRDTLVISLQMFMGKDFQAYDPTLYYDYLRRRLEPEYIVPNSLRAIAVGIYPDPEHARLIELMVEKGKQWWLLDKFMPDAHDSLKTGYTGKQIEWCKENEGNIWNAILQSTPDIYTQDMERIQNYIGEAPRTMDMPEESPGNIGQWVGWQIVKKFEEKNPSMTIQEILKTPPDKIFQESKYKPK